MNEEDRRLAHDTLLEATDLLYVLEKVLDNESQPMNDTKPFACLTKLIQHRVADAAELIQP